MLQQFTLCLLLFFCSFNLLAQNDVNRQREKYERDIQKKQNEMINEFVNELKVDDFQKEIITQKLHSYVTKKQAIMRAPGREFEKKEQFENLDDHHFADISTLISTEVMLEIRDFITMNHVQKKKKKKRRNKQSKISDTINSQNI